MSATLLAILICALPASEIDTLVVCPPDFRAALVPWIEFRTAQGHKIEVIDNPATADQLRTAVRAAAAPGTLRYLVLVGDAEPSAKSHPQMRARSVPTHHAAAVVNVKFGSEPEIATDNWFADLDDDRVPDLAVGRLTADSPTELALMVRKILAYEQSEDYGDWRRQVHFIAGLGGFGALADTVLQAAAKSLIGEGIPGPYCTTMTYGSWQSPYCPDPRDFNRIAVSRLNEGSLFWVYIGHGQQRSVDEVRVPTGTFPILSTRDMGYLSCQHGAPIACFLACYSGAFDQPRDCLGEELLRSPGGPVAVLCGSRVTMPYAMSVLGSELLRQCFVEHAATLGDAMLGAKQRSMSKENPTRHRRSLDAVARTMSPTAAEMDAERAEHLDLFNLLGDPLLRVQYPSELSVEAPATATAGQTVIVKADAPWPGKAVIELSVRRDRLTFQPPRRVAEIDAAAAAA